MVVAFVLGDAVREGDDWELASGSKISERGLLLVVVELNSLIKLFHLPVEVFDLRKTCSPGVYLVII